MGTNANGNGTALLVVDVQTAMFDESYLPHQAHETLATIAGLIERARAAGTPVIYVQHDHASFAPMQRGQPGWEIHPAVAPRRGEPIVHKRACDSFYGTPLRSELDARGVTRLVVAGLQTEYCVDTTCRRAASLDYDVTLAADGHTTWNGDNLSAAQIVAHTNQTLANLAHPSRAITVQPAIEIAL